MASLVEDLVSTLTEEQVVYEKLIPVSERKTKAIVANSLEDLQKVTDEEKVLVDHVSSLEVKRIEVIKNMAIVLSRTEESLNLSAIIDILRNQPEQQKELQLIHDKLKETVSRLKDINAQNRTLIESSLEMIEFNMNFIRSTRMSTGSSNYTRNASEMEGTAVQAGVFDAKQ